MTIQRSLEEQIVDQNNDISELIHHIRLKSFTRVLADYLATVCSCDDVTMLAYSSGKKPMLVYPQGSEHHSPWFKNYLSEEYILDLSLRDDVTAGKKVFRYSDLLEGSITETEYYKRYYRFLEFQDEVILRIPVADSVCLLISLGRKEELGSVSRQELIQLQQLYSIIEAMCQQFWISQGDNFMPTVAKQGVLDTAMNSFGNGILTPREQEVSTMLLKGYNSKLIARELEISVATVKVHRKNIHARLRTSTQSSLFNEFLNYLDDYINQVPERSQATVRVLN